MIFFSSLFFLEKSAVNCFRVSVRTEFYIFVCGLSGCCFPHFNSDFRSEFPGWDGVVHNFVSGQITNHRRSIEYLPKRLARSCRASRGSQDFMTNALGKE